MTSASPKAIRTLPATPIGFLPPRMRVLFITGNNRTGGWLADALAADSASEIVLTEAIGLPTGMARLRDQGFDAVLIGHEAVGLDALEVLDAVRAGSSEQQPILVLGAESEQQMAALCYESGADAYICVNSTTIRTLLWHLARAAERHQLICENRQLQRAQNHRLQLEHDEAERLLEQQRTIIAKLIDRLDVPNEDMVPDAEAKTISGLDLPGALIDHYRELLRTHVIMGSGNLVGEMELLSHMLVTAGVNCAQMMLLHTQVLSDMVRGLGTRSARHVMSRADLLILEVMVHLAEEYRQRYMGCLHPPQQKLLPGFEQFLRAA